MSQFTHLYTSEVLTWTVKKIKINLTITLHNNTDTDSKQEADEWNSSMTGFIVMSYCHLSKIKKSFTKRNCYSSNTADVSSHTDRYITANMSAWHEERQMLWWKTKESLEKLRGFPSCFTLYTVVDNFWSVHVWECVSAIRELYSLPRFFFPG